MHDIDESLLFLVYRADPTAPWLYLMVGASIVGGGYGLVGIVPFAFSKRARATVLHLLVAIAVTALLVFAAKHGLGRSRPYLAVEGVRALGLPPPHDPSCPSGHAAGSACFAAFFADRRRPLRTALLAMGAALVALSRVVLGVHFPLDVAAGALVGSTVGLVAAQVSARKRSREALPPAKSSDTVDP
jgi:undecaprenyl-diphosphatase